jgi:betaine-aldehyde dehydrogenase
MVQVQNFIAGKRVDARGGTTPLVDPCTGESIGEAAGSSADDVGDAIAAADGAFADGGDDPADRGPAILRIADAIEARADDFIMPSAKPPASPRR